MGGGVRGGGVKGEGEEGDCEGDEADGEEDFEFHVVVNYSWLIVMNDILIDAILFSFMEYLIKPLKL